ncbi:MAG: hypothetical protein WCN81_08930 [Actinomycetes bacterium]
MSAIISADTMTAFLTEMDRAEKKHGDGYMGNITGRHSDVLVLREAIITGSLARHVCDRETPGPFDVLMEEAGELAADISQGRDIRSELTQVAAMALAWLEVVTDD